MVDLALKYQSDAHGSLDQTNSQQQLYTPVIVTTGGQGDGFKLSDVNGLLSTLQGPTTNTPYASSTIKTGTTGLSIGGANGLTVPTSVLIAAAVAAAALWLYKK